MSIGKYSFRYHSKMFSYKHEKSSAYIRKDMQSLLLNLQYLLRHAHFLFSFFYIDLIGVIPKSLGQFHESNKIFAFLR